MGGGNGQSFSPPKFPVLLTPRAAADTGYAARNCIDIVWAGEKRTLSPCTANVSQSFRKQSTPKCRLLQCNSTCVQVHTCIVDARFIYLTSCREAQLSTNHLSIVHSPQAVTNCCPSSVLTDLNSSLLIVCPVHKPDHSVSAF